MRIAVCISGQPRSIEFCRKSILNFFSNNEKYQYDFFCHSWDYNTWKQPSAVTTAKELVNRYWLEDQIKLFHPKDYLISTEDYYNLATNNNNLHVQYGSLFYSMMLANHMKRKFEIENNFKYDYVVKIRFDSVFHPQQIMQFSDTEIEERKLFFPHCARMNSEYNLVNASDCVFFGDSWGMDIACDMFRCLPREKRREDDFKAFGPGTLLSQHFNKYNILFERTFFLQETFYRKEVLGLDAINDFDKIRDMHSSFYTHNNLVTI